MKQSDIAMLILITSFSLLVSYFVGSALFAGDANRSAEVQTTESISVDFPQVDETIFNDASINITEKITIGDTNTDAPFSSGDDN